MTKVLVTGGTGFLAGWTIRELLEKGYEVRTTVRSMKKSGNVTSILEKEGVKRTWRSNTRRRKEGRYDIQRSRELS